MDVSEHMDLPLSSFCVNVGNKKRNNFNVMDKDGCSPIKVQVSSGHIWFVRILYSLLIFCADVCILHALFYF